MEVKINREIRQYTESMFMGLNMRQLICSASSVISAVTAWILLRGRLGKEALSWACILSAAPFAALGFVTYNGMKAEQLLWAWLRYAVIEQRKLPSARDSWYRQLFFPKRRRTER